MNNEQKIMELLLEGFIIINKDDELHALWGGYITPDADGLVRLDTKNDTTYCNGWNIIPGDGKDLYRSKYELEQAGHKVMEHHYSCFWHRNYIWIDGLL